MAAVVAGVEDLAKAEVLVVDLDGVLYRGNKSIEGAGEALEQLERAGLDLLFVTNNATKSALEAADTITARTAYAAAESQVITSGLAAAHWMRAEGVESAFVVGEPSLERTLRGLGVALAEEPEEADAVLVGLDREITYRRLADAMTAVLAGATLYATNTDASFPAAEGLLPGAGTIVAAVERATGATSFVCGKPHEPARALVREYAAGRTVAVVGDRPETDLALGIAEGWPTVLTLTGVTNSAKDVPKELKPTAVVRSFADVPAVLGRS